MAKLTVKVAIVTGAVQGNWGRNRPGTLEQRAATIVNFASSLPEAEQLVAKH